YRDLSLQRAQAPRRQERSAPLLQRRGNGGELGGELFRILVEGALAYRRRRRGLLRKRLGGSSEARVDAGDCAAIGLVLPVRGQVARALGERVHLRRDVRQTRRKPELAAELVHFVQVMLEEELGVQPQ